MDQPYRQGTASICLLKHLRKEHFVNLQHDDHLHSCFSASARARLHRELHWRQAGSLCSHAVDLPVLHLLLAVPHSS